MAATEQIPTFNLKAVIQETGLKPDTLRAWERRYGLPQPERTPGRHRLYSQRDIDTLKWLVARQEEGLSISRAVALWRGLENNGQDPLLASGYTIHKLASTPTFVPQGDAIAELRQAWMSACLAFDERRAEQVLSQAFALHTSETVCFEILLKVLAQIGQDWYRGQATVQQEHFTSEMAMRRLEAMIVAAPAPTRAGRILVGCAPEDEHTFVPLLLTFLLRQRGRDVVYLGARVPVQRLSATVSAIGPQLVILTAQQLDTAATLLDAAQAVIQEQTPFAFGGRVFNLTPELAGRIPGHFLGQRLEEGPQNVEQILTSARPSPAIPQLSETYRQAWVNFEECQALLEAEASNQMEKSKITLAHLAIANQMLARNICAALKLGDMDFLSPDIEWIQGLLDNYQIPRDLLGAYLRAYLRAAQIYLDERGRVIIEWLNRMVENG